MKSVAVGVLVAMVAASGAYAVRGVQSASAANQAAAAADSAALKLAKLMLTKDGYKDLLQQTVAGMAAGLRNSGESLPANFEKKLPAVVAEALPYDDMLQLMAKVYGSRFSDQEIGDIVAFYKTPTGAKLIKQMPDITRESMAKVGGLLPQRLPALMKKHGLTP